MLRRSLIAQAVADVPIAVTELRSWNFFELEKPARRRALRNRELRRTPVLRWLLSCGTLLVTEERCSF
jgi:hypothetical protein